MTTFVNHTGQRLFVETWVSSTVGSSRIQVTRVGVGATIPVPDTLTGEWTVSLQAGYTRIGKFRADPAADGKRAWSERAEGLGEYAVGYVPQKDYGEGAAAYYVAWRWPSGGLP